MFLAPRQRWVNALASTEAKIRDIRADDRWRGLRFTEFELRRRQKGTRSGIRGFDHAAGKVIPVPSLRHVCALTAVVPPAQPNSF